MGASWKGPFDPRDVHVVFYNINNKLVCFCRGFFNCNILFVINLGNLKKNSKMQDSKKKEHLLFYKQAILYGSNQNMIDDFATIIMVV